MEGLLTYGAVRQRIAKQPAGRGGSVLMEPAVANAANQAMSRYAAGEDAAFGELYDRVAPPLQRYLRRRTPDPALVDDLVQQTFLKMHRHRGSFVPGSDVLPWALAIGIRLLIDRVRKDKRSAIVLSDLSNNMALPQSYDRSGGHYLTGCSSPSPDELVEVAELARRLEREILDLPPLHREAFQLVKRDGLSVKQAASVLGTTVAGVKLRLFRAYARLRASLADGDT